MGLIGPKQHDLFALHLQLLYLTWFTLYHLHVYMLQTKKSLCLNPKGQEASPCRVLIYFAQKMPRGSLQVLPRGLVINTQMSNIGPS